MRRPEPTPDDKADCALAAVTLLIHKVEKLERLEELHDERQKALLQLCNHHTASIRALKEILECITGVKG